MELTVNHIKKNYSGSLPSLKALLDIEIPGKNNGVAVAINSIVIAQPDWVCTVLKENDEIIIITATQGG